MRHSLWQSFQFAARGMRLAFQTQRTMRIQMGLAAAVVAAVAWLDLPAVEAAVLVVTIAAVLAAELFNTAIEAVVDLQMGGRHHDLAGRIKDLSAASVLVMAAGAAAVALLVLGPPVARALGAGRIDAGAVGRLAVLAAVLALAGVVARRTGERSPRGEGPA